VLAAAGSTAFALINNHRGRGVSAGGKAGEHVPTTVHTDSAPPPSSSTASSKQSQLAQITPLIRQNVSARHLVGNATQQVGGCTMAPEDGITLMRQAISQRQQMISSIDTVSVDTIPDGQQMLADLKQAAQQSIAADQDFIGWMQDIQTSGACPIDTSQDSSYQAGLQASTQATQAKQAFTGLWNPLASQFSQPTFTASQL